MGNINTRGSGAKKIQISTYIGSSILPQAKKLEGMSINELDEAKDMHSKMHMRTHIDCNEFCSIFKFESTEAAQDCFKLFTKQPLLEKDQVFLPAAICARATINETLKWIFQYICTEDYLSRSDCNLAVQSVLHGLAKITGRKLASDNALMIILDYIFPTEQFDAKERINFLVFSKILKSNSYFCQMCTDFQDSVTMGPDFDVFIRNQNSLRNIDLLNDTTDKIKRLPDIKQKRSHNRLAVSKPSITSENFIRAKSLSKVKVVHSIDHVSKGVETRVKWKYSKEEVLGYYSLFKSLDKDGDGTVCVSEFIPCMPLIMQGQVEEIFQQMDKDLSGEISFQELLSFLYNKATQSEITVMEGWIIDKMKEEIIQKSAQSMYKTETELRDLHELFKLYDTDNDGVLSPEEVKDATSCLKGVVSQREVDDIIKLEQEKANIIKTLRKEKKNIIAQGRNYIASYRFAQPPLEPKSTSDHPVGLTFEQFAKIFG